MNIEEFKNKLSNIIVIKDLPIVENIEANLIGEVRDLFSEEYSFELKDGCSVKLSKFEYKCALEDKVNDTEIYTIHSKYNTIFKCFTCGNLLISREDLVRTYDTENIITKKILFPMIWKDQEMIGYIENLIYMIKSNEN